MDRRLLSAGLFRKALGPVLVLAGLGVISRFNYLLFHALAELFSIVIAAGMFTIAWNTRRIIENNYLLFLGLAYLFIGGLDLLHMLAYKGMGVFPKADPNFPTQLWIAARYLEAGSMLAAPFFLDRLLRVRPVLVTYSIICLLVAGSILAGGIFPDCYIEGQGLTPFKKVSEYVISAMLLAAIVALRSRHKEFEPATLRVLTAALACTIAAEMAFSFYVGVYDFSNLVGHYFKLISFFLIYQSLISTGLEKPFDLLFRRLKKSEEALADDNRKLLALQEDLNVKNVKLEKLVEQKNELLGIAAHDIRSPLAIIEMYNHTLKDKIEGTGDEQSRMCTEVVENTVHSMSKMVDNLLDITAIEAGKIDLEIEPIDFKALLEKKVEAYGVLAGRKEIDFELKCHDTLPPVPLDPHRVDQVLDNLFSNAIKYSPRATTVTVRLGREGDEAILSVRNRGQEIPPDELERLFQPFGKTSVKSTGGERSTGLGLAIVKRIVEAHKGRVWVESKAGEGSTFSIALPTGSSIH